MDPELSDAILDPGSPGSRPEDVESPEALTRALYDCISGPAEEERPRDFDRLRALFLPDARLVLTRWRRPEEGEEEEVLRGWDVEGFVEVARAHYREQAFFEDEVGLRVERFGAVAHLFSAYESRVGSRDTQPVMRGVNSLQAVRFGGRWWIAHLIWDVEGPGRPLPFP